MHFWLGRRVRVVLPSYAVNKIRTSFLSTSYAGIQISHSLLHDHPFYFTTVNAFMAGGHNHNFHTDTYRSTNYTFVYLTLEASVQRSFSDVTFNHALLTPKPDGATTDAISSEN